LLRNSLAKVIAEQRSDHIALIPYDTSRAGEAPVMRYWSATHTPIFDETGAMKFVLQHTTDITELETLRHGGSISAQDQSGLLGRVAAVQAENAALSGQAARLRALFEQAPSFMALLRGPNHVFELVNAAYGKLIGHRSDVIGKSVAQVLPEVVEQGFIELLDSVYRSGDPYVGRGVPILLQQAPDAPPEQAFLDFIYQPLRDANGAVVGIFVQGHDITEQKEAEAQMAMLAQESAHRIKNMLAMVHAIATQTMRNSATLTEARDAIGARLSALGQAQDLLTRGSGSAAGVRDVVIAAVRLHSETAGRFHVEGPNVLLQPKAVLGLGLMLHELGTNALKYGALSVPGGRIEVSWTVTGQTIDWSWREIAGPPVVAPEGKGFGSRLIERGLTSNLGGDTELIYAPDGLICRARIAIAGV
jgi:PAS domain S-box-containing protein